MTPQRDCTELGITLGTMVAVFDQQNLASSLGVIDYLRKPVDRDDLRGVMDRFLSRDHEGPLLVIDDDADTREPIYARLTRKGWWIVTARASRTGS